jgi:hypothetical protein
LENIIKLFTTVLSRTLFLGLLGLWLSRTWAGPLDSFSPEAKEELAYATGVQAFIYSYPLLHVNKFRHMFNAPETSTFRGPANHLNHARRLASSQQATAASPNNDTLYTLAFLDLSGQPVRIDTQEMGDRYYTIQLAPLDSTKLPSVPDPGKPVQLWAVINRELTNNPPPPSDRSLVDQFAVVGIGPGQPQDISRLDPALQKGLMRAAATGMQIVLAAADSIAGGNTFNGWGYAQPNVGRYGTDYLYRAGVTRMGLMANDPIEATYLSLYVDADGKKT